MADTQTLKQLVLGRKDVQDLSDNETELPPDLMTVNMGPSHPAMHGTVRIVLTVDGERIVKSDIQPGYLHRCFEKESEHATYTQVFPYTDRLNYVSPLINNFGFAQAVMILGLLLAANYYGLEFGRNIRGIAIGFGVYVSILTANDAMIDLRHGFLPYWAAILPLSSLAMMGIWAWAAWEAAPNPPVPAAVPAGVGAEIVAWAENLNQTMVTVRKVINP